MNVDDLNLGVALEVFAQFGDIDIHTTSSEVAVILPDFLKRVGTVDELIEIDAEQAEQFRLFRSQSMVLARQAENLVIVVEGVVADGEDIVLRFVLVVGAADGGVDASQELFHAEGLGDIVVGTDFKTFEFVAFKALGRKEKDGDALVDAAYFLGHSKAILDGHHDVEDASIHVLFMIDIESSLAIGSQEHGVAFLGEISLKNGTQVGVVFSDQQFNS